MLEKMLALQNKRKKEGGFTLVELIVVLVILAILAALLIPALTGYIDKAREKQIVAETRQCVMAAQTLYDEAYGTGNTTAGADKDVTFAEFPTDIATLQEVTDLAEVTGKGTITNVTVTGGKISTLVWQNTSAKKQCTYDQSKGTYDVTDVTGG